jgi:hypothetical protein
MTEQPEQPPLSEPEPTPWPEGGWDSIWQHMSMFEERIQRLEQAVLPREPDEDIGLP